MEGHISTHSENDKDRRKNELDIIYEKIEEEFVKKSELPDLLKQLIDEFTDVLVGRLKGTLNCSSSDHE